jgi:hypothetical protein
VKGIILITVLLLTGCGELADYGRIANNGETVYYGDSITAFCGPDGIIRAIPGIESSEIVPMVRYFAHRDGNAKYNVLIGINDILQGNDRTLMYSLNRVLGSIDRNSVTVTSILPTSFADINAKVIEHNKGLKALADIYGFEYRDMYSKIKPEHIADGVHLTKAGCEVLYPN